MHEGSMQGLRKALESLFFEPINSQKSLECGRFKLRQFVPSFLVAPSHERRDLSSHLSVRLFVS